MIHPPTDKHPFYYPDYIEYALKKIKKIDLRQTFFDNLKTTIRQYLESFAVIENTIKTRQTNASR
jgi:hypothetical protein